MCIRDSGNVLFLEKPDVFERIDGVSGESRNGFGYDHVHPAVDGVLDHPLEVFPLVDFRPGNRLIGVDSDERPFLLRLDEAPIVFQLGLIAEELLRGIRRDAAIGG